MDLWQSSNGWIFGGVGQPMTIVREDNHFDTLLGEGDLRVPIRYFYLPTQISKVDCFCSKEMNIFFFLLDPLYMSPRTYQDLIGCL